MAVPQKMANFRDAIWKNRKGWIIGACALVVTVLRSGISDNSGIIVVEPWEDALLDVYRWVSILAVFISLFCAPLAVSFIRCLGYRGYRLGGIIGVILLSISCLSSSFVHKIEVMFFTHSILYGVGSSLVYMASSLVIGEYFGKGHKYHVLASSILFWGYPIGNLLFKPMTAWLVGFGWRLVFRVTSGVIFFSGIACCLTFIPKPHTQPPVKEGEEINNDNVQPPEALVAIPGSKNRRCCTLQELKQRPEIMLWYMGNCFSYVGLYMPYLNLPMYMELKGLTTSKASWTITLFEVAKCITCMVASFLGDKLKGRLIYVNIIASIAIAFIYLLWPLIVVRYWVLVVLCMLMGGLLGLTVVYSYAASGEVTKLPINIAWPYTNLWSGVGIVIAPFLSDASYDIRKSYDDVFYIFGALYVLNAVIFAAIPLVGKYRKHKAKCPKQIEQEQGSKKPVQLP